MGYRRTRIACAAGVCASSARCRRLSPRVTGRRGSATGAPSAATTFHAGGSQVAYPVTRCSTSLVRARLPCGARRQRHHARPARSLGDLTLYREARHHDGGRLVIFPIRRRGSRWPRAGPSAPSRRRKPVFTPPRGGFPSPVAVRIPAHNQDTLPPAASSSLDSGRTIPGKYPARCRCFPHGITAPLCSSWPAVRPAQNMTLQGRQKAAGPISSSEPMAMAISACQGKSAAAH